MDAGTVESACLAFGGMAATPKRAKLAEAALVGKPGAKKVWRRVAASPTDFTPLTDMRASAEYRMLAAQNLLRRF